MEPVEGGEPRDGTVLSWERVDSGQRRAAKRSAHEIRRRTAWARSVAVSGVEASPAYRGEDHEEAEAQEGQVDRQDANRALMMQTDFHADEGPEDEEWCCSSVLGCEENTPGGPLA